MASTKRDYYEVLGVNKSATPEELKAAYRKLAMKLHPDRCKEADAKDRFAEVNEAYEVLSDKDKRANYDQFGFDGPQGFGNGPGAGFDPFSFFKSHFGGFGSMFGGGSDEGSPFGFGHQPHQAKPDFDSPENGNHLEVVMDVSFKEMLYGVTKEFDFTGTEECDTCHGKGIKEGSEPKTCTHCNGTGRIIKSIRNGFMMSQVISGCPHCQGRGVIVEICPKCSGNKRVSKKKHVKVKIPEGIATGQRLRLKGEGECGIKGGVDGDLFFKIAVQDLSFIDREGYDLKITLPINPLIASLGGVIEVQTPWKNEKIKIPAGTTTGKIFRINGQGIKTSKRVGDFFVQVVLEPLQNLSESQKKILEEVKNAVSLSNVAKLNEQTTKLKQMFTA